MTRLFLVRHGETIWHAEDRYAGRADVPLNERGRQQARALAAWAATADLSAVWSSTASRAVDTAAPVAAAAGFVHRPDPRLREVDFGEGDGLTREEMSERFPDALDAFLARPATSPLPGGEPGVEASARFMSAVDEIVRDAGADARVLVIAHSTVIRLALCALTGIEPNNYRAVFPRMGNTTLAEVADDGTRPAALLRFNAPARADDDENASRE